jgi:hypothetical protein
MLLETSENSDEQLIVACPEYSRVKLRYSPIFQLIRQNEGVTFLIAGHEVCG